MRTNQCLDVTLFGSWDVNLGSEQNFHIVSELTWRLP